ncbi:Rossmann-like domain-containing protein [Chloroflexota bacterium]
MNILDDLLATLSFDAEVKDIRQGPFQTAVVTRHCGLAATPHDPGPHQEVAPVKEAGTLMARSALELAQMAYSSSLLEAAIGMATINSLLNVDEERCVNLNARDLFAEKGRGKKVAIIGHSPFVAKLRQVVKELWVIEKEPWEGDFAEGEAERLLSQADVVGITGTAITNHTIEGLLSLCRPEAYVVILGGTTPLSPVLFRYGVDAISGTKVVDTEAVLHGVSQGATFRQLPGIQLLTMEKGTNE